MTARKMDVEALERDYRAGILTIRQLADKHGINKSSVVNRAKKHGWQRDLSEAIKARAKAKAVAIDVAATIEENVQEVVQKGVQNVQKAIEDASDALAGIMVKHKRLLASDDENNRKLTDKLQEAIDTCNDPADLCRLITAQKTLAESKAKLIDAERKVYGLDDLEPPKDESGIEAVLEALKSAQIEGGDEE